MPHSSRFSPALLLAALALAPWSASAAEPSSAPAVAADAPAAAQTLALDAGAAAREGRLAPGESVRFTATVPPGGRFSMRFESRPEGLRYSVFGPGGAPLIENAPPALDYSGRFPDGAEIAIEIAQTGAAPADYAATFALD